MGKDSVVPEEILAHIEVAADRIRLDESKFQRLVVHNFPGCQRRLASSADTSKAFHGGNWLPYATVSNIRVKNSR